MRDSLRSLRVSAALRNNDKDKAAQWSMVNGQWSMVNGQWSMANGQWSMVNGQWSMANGQWSMVNGLSERDGEARHNDTDH
ncbi:MAG: hypothetical protein IKR98_06655 [Bacteroidaceae bacterium]|nr:hypothetical protein [Bacteroidaceae bacterium]